MLFGKPQNPKQLQKQVLFILQEAEFQFFTGSVLHELQYGHKVTPKFEQKTDALLKRMICGTAATGIPSPSLAGRCSV